MNTPEHSSSPGGKRTVFGVCIFLAVIVFLVFGQTCRFEFVNYDDDHHVYANAAVTNGLTLKGIEWAFKPSHSDYWHPLDFVSHMADCQLYGLNPGGHHFTNVLLHAVVAILLFLVLRRMTDTLWPSAFVAALFAIHPLRVESVAWISERKDILQGLFFVLTISAYIHYARKPWSLARYLAVLFLFALGLMSKPTLMTLPFLLLLFDYWPLNRFSHPGRIVLEKIPLLLLSIASCLEAVAGNSLAFESSKAVSHFLQFANALVSCVIYLWQMIWPVKLAVLYPFPVNGIPLWEIIISFVLLVFISTTVFILRHKRPYLLVGWFWYLGMLAPMAGIIQAGAFARADRYTYLPHIGLYLLVAFAVKDLSASWRCRRQVLWVAALAMITALSVCAWIQTSYWRNSELLWKHTIACTPANVIAHSNLGVALAAQHRFDEAVQQYQQAININPEVAETYRNLAAAFTEQGRLDEAVQCYQRAIEKKPDYAEAHNNLGILLARQGRPDEAIGHLQKALAIKPDYAEADNNMGIVLASQSRFDEAIITFQEALSIKPDYADAHYNLANVFAVQGRKEKALIQYEEALRLNPANDSARQQIHVLSSNH